jgi:polyhydroxybutyrate depolymerase
MHCYPKNGNNNYLKQLLVLLLICKSTLIVAQTNHSFTFDGVNRTYIVNTPTGYNTNQKYPLVFILHGVTQTANGMMNYSGFNTTSNDSGFIAVYADGVNNSWNSTMGASGTNDIGFINALLDTMMTKYSVNPARVYSCGFSNGGYMSHRIACELGNRFAAIASVAGTMCM